MDTSNDMDHAGQEQAMSEKRQWTRTKPVEAKVWKAYRFGDEADQPLYVIESTAALCNLSSFKDRKYDMFLEWRQGDTVESVTALLNQHPLPNSSELPNSSPAPSSQAMLTASTATTEDGERWTCSAKYRWLNVPGMPNGPAEFTYPDRAEWVCAAGNALLAEIARLRGENERLAKDIKAIEEELNCKPGMACEMAQDQRGLIAVAEMNCMLWKTRYDGAHAERNALRKKCLGEATPSTPGAAKGDGGPAFPGGDGEYAGNPQYYAPGMSLRDWFAGQSITAVAANSESGHMDCLLAAEVWSFADEMLAGRTSANDGGQNNA